ncbi:MAG: flavin reductase [Phyllobacteriaceae bacterium]|nr:flavin reductase [Phyllobacteriaceae bacterium]
MLSKSRISSQDYRDCMARFAGAVHVVATDGPAGLRGVTVSAVTSVSDNPPTLLVCLNRNRPENGWFGENGHFSLNTLCADQIDVARAFAGEGHLGMEERFAAGQWRRLVTGSPVLEGARMALDCRVTNVLEVATHMIIFGEVAGFNLPAGDEPPPALCYMDRDYRVL